MDNVNKLLTSSYIFFVTAGLLTWMHQESLERFWQQSYHQPPPWHGLKTVAAWQAGTRVHPATARATQSFWLEMQGLPIQTATAQMLAATTTVAVEPPSNDARCAEQTIPVDTSLHAVADEEPAAASEPPEVSFKQRAQVAQGQRVFFAGDSMMQGVAPHLAARLRREYGLTSVDLSRQSTGLAYPKAFNWPATIAQTLETQPNIKLLVIFLGPNDPWDMPSGQGGQYLRYASPDWEQLYRSRIREIIQSAQNRHVDLIWVGPPNMRRRDLSSKVSYLSELYESEVLEAGEVFLSSNQVLKYLDAAYSDYMGDGSLKQKMRSGDGVHFTPTGQRTLADAVFDLIVFTPQQQAEHDSQTATHTFN